VPIAAPLAFLGSWRPWYASEPEKLTPVLPVFGHGLRPDASAFVTISIFLRFLFKPVNRLSRPSLSVLIHQNRQLINMLTLRDYTMKNLIAALVAGLFAVSAFAAGHSAAPAAPAKAAAPAAAAPAASATPATPATPAAASADAPKAKKEKKEKKEKKAKKTKEAKADAAPASK
jgi:hypothetical protein